MTTADDCDMKAAFRNIRARTIARGGEFRHEEYTTPRGRRLMRLAVGSGGATCEPLMWWARHAYTQHAYRPAMNACEGPIR